MTDDMGEYPARDAEGGLVKPKLTGLGISKASLEEMAARPVDFTGKFCLTGVFAFGPREAVEQAIKERGGTLTRHVARKGCTLVVGTAASDGWVGGDHGRKIEDAVECIRAGRPVVLITEDRLTEAILQTAPLPTEPPAMKMERYARLAASGDLTSEEADLLLHHFVSPHVK